ncbi:GntP family permease [Anaerosphaera multitolerans]|uniref:GntP family permease n=1 Tax=Anaerosphaera multitolerans TaxID=2487351 RepID=A0A437S665_9FIRM|nr:GntP family permease [Anaerosphaera multitolerans]RVU54533.1 GntP family permease [Anaerosphaera multitolerans]
MNTTLTIIALFLALFTLIFLTIKVKLHPFFSLLLSSFVFGIVSGMGMELMLENFAEGMGSTIAGIGVVITIGTVTGSLLEKSGSAETMARSILKITGEKHASLGLAITGYFVSIPVFCDSAMVLLSPIAKRLSRDTKISMTTMTVSLAMGLHATHMLVPPTPGPLAVAGILNANLGTVIAMGALVSIPVTLVAHFLATKFGKKYYYLPENIEEFDENQKLPNAFMAFTPIIIPIFLMVLKTIVDFPSHPFGEMNAFVQIMGIIGQPMIALLIGMCIALFTYFSINPTDKEVYTFNGLFGESLMTAGQIVLIVGAGGAFGSILKASALQDILVNALSGVEIGILAPFLIGAIFRTAIGSGTVAMVTSASMILPMLDILGMSSPMGTVIAMLACAAGGFMVFHGNDDFFWVTASTTEMDTSIAYKTMPIISIAQSFTALICVYILKIIFI